MNATKSSSKTNYDIPAVLVNAGHATALAVMRSLGRHGIPVVCVFEKARHPDRYYAVTKQCKYITRKYYYDSDPSGDNMMESLSRVAKSLRAKAVLFPLSDGEMAVISRNRNLLEEHYHLLMPPHDVINTILQKDKFAEFALQNELPIPRTVFPNEESDLDEVRESFHFPCIIKPPWRDSEWLESYGSRKVLHLHNFEELRQAYRALSPRFRGLIIQEVLSGLETNIRCSFTYLDEHSQPLGMFVCRKIRQFPPFFGSTAMAESILDPEIAALTETICRKLKLVGYISIEFKKDPADASYKIIEITPARVDTQVGITGVAGVDIPFLWYRHLIGRTLRVNGYSLSCKWVSETNDLRALPYYLKTGEFSLKTWINSYQKVQGWEIFARDDLLPFFALFPTTLLFMLSKVFNRKRKVSSQGPSL